MPYKNIEDRRRFHRENNMRKRREAGIPEKKLMPEEQRILHQRAASRRHYNSHLEQERQRTAKWKKDNPDKQRFMEKRRRARKKNAPGSHTYAQWLQLKKEYGNMCVYCQRREPDIKLTQDHIIPLSKGGSDDIENIQPLCFSCNSSKQDKIMDRDETHLLRFING
jgi:5-methylcytosine-specific restriction endonuclease McrA